MDQGTYFAPGERDSLAVINDEAAVLASSNIGQDILDAIPDMAMILNDKRQIVAANSHTLKALELETGDLLVGQRPGEILSCKHSFEGPQGCGTSEACRQCGAARAILTCLKEKHAVQYECRISAKQADSEVPLEFLARANYVKVGPYPLVLLVLRDISAEKRKQTLERLFFHDVLNSVGGIVGLSELMMTGIGDESTEYATIINRLAGSLTDEITAYRSLIQAEAGTLFVSPSEFSVNDLLDDVRDCLASQPVSDDREIKMDVEPNLTFCSDSVLVRRVVLNLAKNALEACPIGSQVKVSAGRQVGCLTVSVNNPGTIPVNVQSQIFKRSFSTKGEPGRGIGTYSIKLFTERYLRGSVCFSSSKASGTTFVLSLPEFELPKTALRQPEL